MRHESRVFLRACCGMRHGSRSLSACFPYQFLQCTMKAMQSVIVALVLASLTSAFNLEPRESIILSDTARGQVPGGRESYFGFSVALHYLARENEAWLAVGAPRANSSYYNPDHITEPGAIYKCNLRSQECEELFIDDEGNTGARAPSSEFRYMDLKNGGWLGGALDSQPTYQAGRQSLGVCAPRWKNQLYQGTYLMNGACYWLNSSLPNEPAHKKLPLIQFSKQTFPIGGRRLFFYSHGGAGLSVHFSDNPTEMIVGAPGVFNWQGTVIRFKDAGLPPIGEISRRRRRRRQTLVSEHQMFSSQFVPNPYYTSSIKDFDLLGYSVTSGHFLSPDEIHYAAGATRGGNSLGKVLLFSFPPVEEMRLYVIYEWVGTQIGENFGASLVSADVNGDGLSDLVVGAPMFFTADASDMGKVVVYETSVQQGETTIEKSERRYHGSAKAGARFGTTLAACGDLNQDGFQDIAVGAPWEDGHGAVYIYLGSPQGLRSRFSQHLLPQDFSAPFSGFGMSISRGIDIDQNGYPDLAIGSFLSGHAVVLRSRPVVDVRATVSSRPTSVALNATSLQLVVCFDHSGYNVPSQIALKGNITLGVVQVPPDREQFFVFALSHWHFGLSSYIFDYVYIYAIMILMAGQAEGRSFGGVSRLVCDAGQSAYLRVIGAWRWGILDNMAKSMRYLKFTIDIITSWTNRGAAQQGACHQGRSGRRGHRGSTRQRPSLMPLVTVGAKHLKASWHLYSLQYSKEEQILYQRLEENKINTTITPKFLHFFSLAKNGPTPLGEVELVVDIPVNFTTRGRSETFLNIYNPKTNFQHQGFQCSIVGASYVPDEEAEGDTVDIPTILANSSTQPPIYESLKASSMQSKASSLEPAILNCSNPLVSCARLSCLIKSWPASTGFAHLTINLSLNLTVLAGHISAKGGAIVKSHARARILSLNPELSFVGEKETEFVLMTQIQPDSLPGRGVPWWVILLAVLGGLLLLCLLAYGLYKAGFFKRKEQDEMKAHRAQVASSNYGTVNDGMVGD
nr:integrin alpha-PS3-like [Penaeus vannamei]